MKYLTRSYVEWLGLEIKPFRMARNQAMVCSVGNSFNPHRTLVPAGESQFREGVILDGVSYLREEPDGLAYVRL